MYYEIIIAPDADMPKGLEWVRVRISDDRFATYFSETYAARHGRRVLCHDGIPVDPPRDDLRVRRELREVAAQRRAAL